MVVVCLDMYVEEHYPRLKTNAVSWYGRPRIPKRGFYIIYIEQILKIKEL